MLLQLDNVGIIANAYGQPVDGSLVFHNNLDSIREISSYMGLAKDIQKITFGGGGVGGPCIVVNKEDGSGKLVVTTAAKAVCYRKLKIY